MTEDMLEEQAEVLIQLGADARGTELRQRMQSACLLSDMESFKVRGFSRFFDWPGFAWLWPQIAVTNVFQKCQSWDRAMLKINTEGFAVYK
jgi:hypothetical protein